MNEKITAPNAGQAKDAGDMKTPIALVKSTDRFEPMELMIKLNEIIERVNYLQKNGETVNAALYRTIQKFEAHSHNGLGIAVSPVGS